MCYYSVQCNKDKALTAEQRVLVEHESKLSLRTKLFIHYFIIKTVVDIN